MTEDDVDQLADAITQRLHKSLLQIPAPMAEEFKRYAGYQTHMPIGGSPDLSMKIKVLTDGSLDLQICSYNGRFWQAVLSP